MTITDPLRARPLAPTEALPGLRVVVRQQQWLATIVALDGAHVWVQYDEDRKRGILHSTRVPLAEVCRLADVLEKAD